MRLLLNGDKNAASICYYTNISLDVLLVTSFGAISVFCILMPTKSLIRLFQATNYSLLIVSVTSDNNQPIKLNSCCRGSISDTLCYRIKLRLSVLYDFLSYHNQELATVAQARVRLPGCLNSVLLVLDPI